MSSSERCSVTGTGRRGRGAAFAKLLVTTAYIGLASYTLQPVRAVAQTANQADSVRSFNIPAQPLPAALNAFGRQSGLQVTMASSAARGVTSGPVNGNLTREQALSRLLGGTGLSYAFTDANTVTITDRVAAAHNGTVAADGSLTLDTIDVTGRNAAGGFTPDTPYETAGSVSHISREQIDRVPPSSAGDVFRSSPGVISAGSRVGTSINPNIRGLQGMGRVNTTVDGARQTSSSYRGYIGNRDESYIDPDMIGGVDITKGPSEGAGVGGIGGTVNFRTLLPEDIIKNGKTWGVRLKGSLANNTQGVPALGTVPDGDRPSFLGGDGWSGSIAAAGKHENVEVLAAYSKRKHGNYFVGTNAADGIVFPPGQSGLPANTILQPGAEAPDTSEDMQSLLLKGKAKWGNGQSLELGYLLYDSKHGELNELLFAPWYPATQHGLTTTRVDTYTAKYRYDPEDSDLVDVRMNLWYTDLNVDRSSDGLNIPDHRMRTTGADIGNTSVFDTGIGTLTLNGGAEFVLEHASALQNVSNSESWGPSGVRSMYGAYLNGKMDLTPWLTLSAGGRYDGYTSKGEGYQADYPDRDGSRFSPNIGVTVTPLDGIQLFGQYKEGFRPPSLRESHWNYGGLLRNNPDLKPELSKNFEVGVNVLKDDVFLGGDAFRFKAAYFNNHYDDYIVRAIVSPEHPSGPYHFTNLDSATYEGFEISGSYDAGTFFLEGSFTHYLTVEYCPVGGTCRVPLPGGIFSASGYLQNDYMSNYIPPKYSGSLTAGVRLFDQALTLGARATYGSTRIGTKWEDVKGKPGQVGYQFTWPAYAVFDIFGSYKFNDTTTLNFSVENITDEYYFEPLSSVGIPSPGRTARASLTVQF